MTRYTIAKLLALCMMSALLLCGCRGHRHDGKMIFRYNESAGIATLDPAFAKDQSIIWGCRQLYNGLVQLDTALQVQPCIAKRWTVSPDGLTYSFTLRDDVFFHRNALFPTPDSTRRVVAEDFVYSFTRVTDPAVASPGAWIFSCVKAMEAPDDTTFVVHLHEPFAPFLSMLGMVYCSVVPREVVEHYGKDFRSHPCGTGPFRLQYWKEGVKMVLRKNPDYFEYDTLVQDSRPTLHRLPYLDAVAVTFIVDRHTVFLEFVKGNLDFMNSLDASYKDEILTPDGRLKEKYAHDIDMVSTPYLNTEYLGFNMENSTGLLRDVRLRQAINYGVDRRKMMRYLRNNVGAPGTGGFIPRGLPGYSDCGYEYDPQQARRLLEEVRQSHGLKELPPLKLSTTSNYLDLCKFIQQQLGLLGLRVEVDVNPPAPLREQMAQGKVEWFRGSWVADYPDAENYLLLFHAPNRAPAGPNYTRFDNAEVSRLYLRARRCTDPAERTALYQRIDCLVMREAPAVVLYYDQILHFTHHNVIGLRSNAMNNLDLRRVRVTEKREIKN